MQLGAWAVVVAATLFAGNAESRPAPSPCGNGIIDGTEECDDGNRTDGDGCSSACIKENPDAEVLDAESPDADEGVDSGWDEDANGIPTDAGGMGGEDATTMGGGDARVHHDATAVPADSGLIANDDASTAEDAGVVAADATVTADAGAAGGEDDEDGCGCAATGASRGGLWGAGLLALGALWLSRGRRRG